MKSVARKRVVLASVNLVSRFICLRLRGLLYAALQACAISQPMLTIWATFTISSSGIATSTSCRAQPPLGTQPHFRCVERRNSFVVRLQ